MKMFQEPGQSLADATGHRQDDVALEFLKYGVFQSKSNPPTKKAIDDAELKSTTTN